MELFIILLSLLLIAFFSGIEIAFVSANKLRIELLKEKGSAGARIVSEFTDSPSKFISTMLIGLNIAMILFGAVTSDYLTRDNFSFLPEGELPLLIVQTIIIAFVVLIFGELVPKILFRVNPDQTLLWFSYFTKYLFYVPLKPLTNVFYGISRWIIKKIVGRDVVDSKPSFTKEDLEYLIKETAITNDQSNDDTDHLNSEIFEKALYLKDIKVRNCMVPRPEIQGVEITEELEAVKKKFIESKLSRIIVYDEVVDKVLGYIHHFDMLGNPTSLKQITRTMLVIPETMTARDLMLQFIRDKRNIAWVVDEYGGTAGIITLEDLMEQIFGEIEDEHDTENLMEKKVSDSEFIFSGRLEIDYLNGEYNLQIPEGEYTTLSGYIINGFEDIPEAGTSIDLDQKFHVKIMKATDKRIELVKMTLVEEE